MSLFLLLALITSALATYFLLRAFAAAGLALKGLPMAVVGLALAGTIGLYLLVGRPDGIDPSAHELPDMSEMTLEQAIEVLESRLEQQPGDLEGWILLAQAEQARSDYAAAAAALEQARDLAPDNPNVLVDLAQTRSFASGDRRFDDRSVQLLDQALAVNPDHQRGLFLAGIAAVQRGQSALAESHWQRLLTVLPADSSVAASVREQLRELGSGERPSHRAPAEVTEQRQLPVSVELSDELQSHETSQMVLFVYARAAGGPTMPIAVARMDSPQFPITIGLARDQGMAGNRSLDDVERIEIIARLSRSGNATPQPGDLQGQTEAIDSSIESVSVRIDTAL